MKLIYTQYTLYFKFHEKWSNNFSKEIEITNFFEQGDRRVIFRLAQLSPNFTFTNDTYIEKQ